MKKTVKKGLYIAVSAVLLLAVTTAFAAVAVPAHTGSFYVNDFAGVLSDEAERYIAQKSSAYDDSDGTQVVVTTIKSLEGSSIEDYAIAMAREWGIGGAEQDNGLLILLSVDDREVRVEVGYGLEGVINDGKAGRFIRNNGDSFSGSRWEEGLLGLYNDVLGELENPTPNDKEEDEGGSMIGAIAIVVLLILVFSVGGAGRGGGFRRYPRTFYGGHHGGFGGGGFGGGGFGGGGGRSGGGGGFGGGGASGKF